ncbi:hypothetical protein AB4Y42_39080 [Paraburkholderia sp. EG286B]|uniref:hypothetical protein n=1 Tax=Paraburkholderia sp. EG286B TaxID=3237011 RepID=UPI0034D2E280
MKALIRAGPFNSVERQALLKASFEGADAVDTQIEMLRAAHPYAFHTSESLSIPNFFDQPKHELPCRGFVRACEEAQE